MIMLALTVTLWRKLSNGNEKIMWHNRLAEFVFLGAAFAIILSLAIVTGAARPESPIVFPYSKEYPQDIMYSDINNNAIAIKPELLSVNKAHYPVNGLQIAEDQS